MMLTIGRIDRVGEIHLGDARLAVWEEGISDARAAGGFRGAEQWERQFKRDVFARIVQQLNRLGWVCIVPADKIRLYGASFARSHRYCRKGELQAELSVSGRCIEFQMWQAVNTPTRPDYGGRYESNKEACAPYLLRLEMQRTRSRIREYLCNVFTGYSCVPPKLDSPNPDPLAWFNSGWDGEYEKRRGVHRFDRGLDGWPSDKELRSWSRADADGVALNHGAVRWWRDRKGRLIRGRVYGGINGMWALIYGPGRRDHTRQSARDFFTYKPGMARKLAAPAVREKRLKGELAKAIETENFERAAVLRDVIRADALAAAADSGTESTQRISNN
jgi:hypothetical protein